MKTYVIYNESLKSYWNDDSCSWHSQPSDAVHYTEPHEAHMEANNIMRRANDYTMQLKILPYEHVTGGKTFYNVWHLIPKDQKQLTPGQADLHFRLMGMPRNDFLKQTVEGIFNCPNPVEVFGARYVRVAQVAIEHTVDCTELEKLGLVFQKTNSFNNSWFENVGVTATVESARSTSVGDVISVGDSYFAVASVGFVKVDVSEKSA